MVLLLKEIIESQVAFKNCAPFIKCITEIDGTTKDHAEDLDLVMLMYNLLEYSSNYSDRTVSLWFLSKDVANHFNANIANTNAFKYLSIRLSYWGTQLLYLH